MDSSKVEEIFVKVLELTINKKIKWEITNFDNSIFEVSMSQLRILMRGSGNSYSFLIENSNGLIIAQLNKDQNPFSGVDINTYLPLEELWDRAKSSALNIDDNLNDLLSNLNQL